MSVTLLAIWVQLTAMAVDLVMLIAIGLVADGLGLFGWVLGAVAAVAYGQTNGGWFYAWRPSSIRAFWRYFND